MSRIFIFYCRSDSISEAGRIYDYLANHFGRASIFKDVDNIDAGDDFRDRVIQAIGQCQILLAPLIALYPFCALFFHAPREIDFLEIFIIKALAEVCLNRDTLGQQKHTYNTDENSLKPRA